MKKNLLEIFESIVRSHSSDTAIEEKNKQITFNELRTVSLILATSIYKNGFNKNEVGAVLLPKSINCVVADLALGYCNGIYMNIDVNAPLDRIFKILEHIQPRILITSSEIINKMPLLQKNFELILIDKIEKKDIDVKSIIDKLESAIDTDPYTIINTSGSTGIPKGVVLNHRNFLDFLDWSVEEYKFNSQTIIGSLSPSIFDIYSFELMLMMARGAKLVLIPEEYGAFPASLPNYINIKKINFIFWVPTVMVNISKYDILKYSNLDSLKLIWFAGEVFPTIHFNYWKKKLPFSRFVNLYGPIEITLDCTFYEVKRELRDDEPIPIGKACINTDLLILNELNKKCCIDEIGELCVRGSSLAMGYFNDLERTERLFIQNPLNSNYPELIYRTGDLVKMQSDGDIIFIGRADQQIKRNGYRIDLQEIEHVLVSQIGVFRNACALYDKDNNKINIFYESEEKQDIYTIKKKLSKLLPKYMIPDLFFFMVELPRNVNGKIDRHYLTSLQ